MSIKIILICIVVLGGCAGLNQFPRQLEKPSSELTIRDPEYVMAVSEIGTATTADEKKLRRNQEIERRIRVIDLNFNDFQIKLAKENVRANFGVAVVQVGVGAAGSLVSETASQILSAVSGGLAGTQQAYTKSAMFDQALSSLLAQMVASRKAIMVKIYEGMNKSIDEYPLAEAAQDIESYYFAGSLPGAIIATSADAKVKNDEAEIQLTKIRDKSHVTKEVQQRIDKILDAVDKLAEGKALKILQNPPLALTSDINAVITASRGSTTLNELSDTQAKSILKRVLVLANRSNDELKLWEAAVIAE